MTHTITWDHENCEHDDDPTEHWCSPARADVTCDDLACAHRRSPDYPEPDPYCDESWYACRGDCLRENDWSTPHVDPGVDHSTRGYPIEVGPVCSAAVWLSEDQYLGGTVIEYRDGPIDVEWMVNGYIIRHLDPVPRYAVE